MLVSFLCFVLMGSAVVIYFLHQASTSPYALRLDHIEDYPVDKELEELRKYYKDELKVKDVNVRLQGKIIYITVEVDPSKTLEDMQKMGVDSLDKLTEDQKSFYDIQFSFQREGYASYEGSKSSSKTVITWANYDLNNISSTTTTTKKK